MEIRLVRGGKVIRKDGGGDVTDLPSTESRRQFLSPRYSIQAPVRGEPSSGKVTRRKKKRKKRGKS